jgi:hypothetical protein
MHSLVPVKLTPGQPFLVHKSRYDFGTIVGEGFGTGERPNPFLAHWPVESRNPNELTSGLIRASR